MDKYLYSSCSFQLKIPDGISKQIQTWSIKNIPDEKLYIDPNDQTYGRELHPHITICFGIDEVDKEEILNKLGNQPIVKISMGKIKIFKSGKYGVLYIDILPENDHLNQIYKIISSFSKKIFPSFTPHSTIAYVLPGFAEQITSNETLKNQFSKIKLELTELEFVKRDGSIEIIKLGQ